METPGGCAFLHWLRRQDQEPLERTIHHADHNLLGVRAEQRSTDQERRRT